MTQSLDLLQRHRSPLLDAIRGIAVLLVVFYHCTIEYEPQSLDAMARWLAKYGFLGVDVFFPLSGFLITGFLLRRHALHDVRVFFQRRLFRILPLYWLALATWLIAALVTGQGRELIPNLWQNALFITGWMIYANGRSTVPFTITWSLSVEELAYVIIGVAALFLRRRMPIAILLVGVASFLLRIWLGTQESLRVLYFYPPARLDSIMIGGILAWFVHQKSNTVPAIICILGASLLMSSVSDGAYRALLLFNVSLMTCLAIAVAQKYLYDWRSPFIIPLADIGFYSYFIYLFHYFNVTGLDLALSKFGLVLPFWPFSALVILVTYLQARLSFLFFEGPVMLWGRRHEGSGQSPDHGSCSPRRL